MKELKTKSSIVAEVYNSETTDGKKAIERLYGKDALAPIVMERPVGLWCLGINNTATTIDKWNSSVAPLGVGIVTEDRAIIVAPHASVALQWGAMGKNKSPLIRDRESFDSKAATDAMIAAYAGAHHEDNSGKIWSVDGAPAAEFCRQYSNGDIGVGEWDLPALAPLQLIQSRVDEINDHMKVMGGWKLTNGWHWSSTENNESSALCVGMLFGYVGCSDKDYAYSVRAVSAFHFENFKF